MSTDDLQKLVDDAVKNAKVGESTQGGNKLVNGDELKNVEKALAERIYNRIIDGGYYRPPVGSMYYRPYYVPYLGAYHMPYDLSSGIHRVLGLHDYLNKYDIENRVISHVTDPGTAEILGVMYDLINKEKQGKEGEKKAALA